MILKIKLHNCIIEGVIERTGNSPQYWGDVKVSPNTDSF